MSEPATPKSKSKRGLAGLLMSLAVFASGAAAGGAGAGVAMTMLGHGIAKPGGKAAAHAPAALEYVEIDNAFTSNLTDTGRYLQLRIAVSTTGGAPVVASIATHKLAIVSSVLAVLGDLAENDIADRRAKSKLKVQLREAVDGVLRQKAGGGSIDEVFLTSLVVQ